MQLKLRSYGVQSYRLSCHAPRALSFAWQGASACLLFHEYVVWSWCTMDVLPS